MLCTDSEGSTSHRDSDDHGPDHRRTIGTMSLDGMTAWGRGHAVSFYAVDSEGIDAVARFVADGWDLGECVVGSF